jgi:hypothetical protein
MEFCMQLVGEGGFLTVCVYPQEWIMEQWEKNYYISAIAGANNGSSLVVMSKG